jgi:hypothetical protein
MAESSDDYKKKALALVTIAKLNRSGISCPLTYGGSSKRTRLLNVGSLFTARSPVKSGKSMSNSSHWDRIELENWGQIYIRDELYEKICAIVSKAEGKPIDVLKNNR